MQYGGYHKYDKKVALTYEIDRSCEEHWVKENKYVEDYFKNHRISTLLDIPVGTGRFFQYYTFANTIIGLDISEAMLDEARLKLSLFQNPLPIVLEKGDVFDIQYADNYFDCVVVFRLFHLIPKNNLALAIQELCRVSKKDIIVQSYEQPKPSFFQSVKRKIRAVYHKIFNIFFEKKPITYKETPWSHIEAYFHEQGFISSFFQKNGFIIKNQKQLSTYNGMKVFATIYAKS